MPTPAVHSPARPGVLAASSVCLAVTVGAAATIASAIPLGRGYVVRVTMLFASSAAVAAYLAGATLRARFGIANTVTLLRLGLVVAISLLLWEAPSAAAAGVVVVVTLVIVALDAVDGQVARRTGTATPFGARFDTETDAALILLLSALAWQHGKAGAWILAAGALRYLFVASGWLLPWMAAPLTPTRRGRIVAVLQMVGLTVVMTPVVPPPWSTLVAATSLAVLSWSFALDVGRLWRGAGHRLRT